MIINIHDKNGSYAVVKLSGNTIYTFNLFESNSIEFYGANNTKINIKTENGYVWVEHSDCPDKICEKKGKISGTSENIVCMPAEVVIEIKSQGNGSEIDAVS